VGSQLEVSLPFTLMHGKAAWLDTGLFTSYSLACRTTYESVSSLQVGGQSVYMSPTENSATLNEVDLLQPASDLGGEQLTMAQGQHRSVYNLHKW